MIRRVVEYTDTTGFGGAEQALLHLLAGLDRSRWMPTLVYHPSAGITPLEHAARLLEIALVAMPPMPEGGRGAMQVPGFVRWLRAERPHVMHAHLTRPLACKWGLAAAIAARVPAVIATVQLFVEVHATFSSYVQQRVLSQGVDRYIAVSHDVAQRMQRRFRVPSHKITVIHNGVTLPPIPGVARDSGRRSQPMVVTSARLDLQKGHIYLLHAAALLPDVRFVLAGDGPLREELEACTRALGIEERVTFLGFRDDVTALLSRCDLFVLPSLYEGLPLALLEAMAAGKPVVATAIGGTTEVIEHGVNGLLVAPRDPQGLADAIRTLIAEPHRAQRLAQAGQSTVERRFSTRQMVQRIEGLYNELVDG